MDPLNTPMDSVFFPDIGYYAIFFFSVGPFFFIFGYFKLRRGYTMPKLVCGPERQKNHGILKARSKVFEVAKCGLAYSLNIF